MDTPQKSVAMITAIAITISEGRTERELIYISEMLSLLGHTLKTIAFSSLDLKKGKLGGEDKKDGEDEK